MTKVELLTENEKLKARIAELEQDVESLSRQLQEALSQLEAKGRAGKRQAAPFSRGDKKQQPKRPGRKKGHQPVHRAKPDKVDRELNASLKQRGCLHCGGVLSEPRLEQQYQLGVTWHVYRHFSKMVLRDRTGWRTQAPEPAKACKVCRR